MQGYLRMIHAKHPHMNYRKSLSGCSNKNPNWMLVEIYADEGISGTSLQHRDAFKKMIEDCEGGKIDLIITKSVSRFARNVVDCIRYVRELSSLRPPVGVFLKQSI